MPTRIRWRNLLPGIFAVGIVLLAAAAVLLFAGVGQVRGRKLHVFLRTDQARGIMRGSEVWLAGQKVGTVEDIKFAPPSADSGRVILELSIKKSQADKIRADSRADIRAGANIMGPIVVYVTAGTPAARALQNGDTLRAAGQSDLEVATAKMGAATADLKPIVGDVHTIMGHVRGGSGTIGAAMTDMRGGSAGGGSLRANFVRLRARIFGPSNRSAAPARNVMSGGEVTHRTTSMKIFASEALAQVDSIRSLLRSPNTSLGRFRRDSTLGHAVASVRDELARVRARVAEPDGTLGRYKSDSALTRSIASAHDEMALLFADIKKRPLRYIAF